MKPKRELMKRLRSERKEQGLVELRLWLTPAQRERVIKYANRIRYIPQCDVLTMSGG